MWYKMIVRMGFNICKWGIQYQFSNLIVKEVSIRYLIGMKLTSARGQDLADVASILNRDNDEQPYKLLSELSSMGFDIDISILLDAYEGAFGMAWLDEFYIKNESELRKYCCINNSTLRLSNPFHEAIAHRIRGLHIAYHRQPAPLPRYLSCLPSSGFRAMKNLHLRGYDNALVSRQ
jgi:hypothetical protein